jgi:predicted DNA-binding transcriptional regulator AlpA
MMRKPSTIRLIKVAEFLGVSKQRAHQIVDEDGFPAPAGREGQSLWDRRELAAWAKEWR